MIPHPLSTNRFSRTTTKGKDLATKRLFIGSNRTLVKAQLQPRTANRAIRLLRIGDLPSQLKGESSTKLRRNLS